MSDLEAKLQQQAEEAQAALHRVEEALKQERAERESVRGEVEARLRDHEGVVQVGGGGWGVCVRCFGVDWRTPATLRSKSHHNNDNTTQQRQALQGDVEKARREAKAKGDVARKLLEEKDREIGALRGALERMQVQQGGQGQGQPGAVGAGAVGGAEEGQVGVGVEEQTSSTPSPVSSPAPTPPARAQQQQSPLPLPVRPAGMGGGGGVTTAADFAEQQLFQLARKQAQRDEELGRLKQQMRHIGGWVGGWRLGVVWITKSERKCNRSTDPTNHHKTNDNNTGEQMREKEAALARMEEELRARGREVEDLKVRFVVDWLVSLLRSVLLLLVLSLVDHLEAHSTN